MSYMLRLLSVNQHQGDLKIIKRKKQYSWNIFRRSRTLQMCYVKFITFKICMLKGKVVPTGHAEPEGSRRVKAPSFRDNGTNMYVRKG